ncbi:hypothetical protein [Flavitalea sp.]|nr:hypothetical protein [Flavitalea sp.]
MDEDASKKISACAECDSEYNTVTSEMTDLCPECSHILYGYKNCPHHFENGRCIKCAWDGSESEYIHKLKERKLHKSKKIFNVLESLENKYGRTNIVINDHWEGDREAIGLTDKTRQYLGYISTYRKEDGTYFLSLENPPSDDKMRFTPAGEFDNITFADLEKLLIEHLRLTK